MATAIPHHTSDVGTLGKSASDDGRVAAFCSTRFPELFHAFAYATDIWKQDPFDVNSIHGNARDKFQRIVNRVLEPTGLASGRILLLLGESGCGKTHLMRAFRNQVHSQSSGYCGYLQMTAFTGHYARYVLNNLIDSLDKPYDDSRSSSTGLMRLSNKLAELCLTTPADRLDQFREGGLDQAATDRLIGEMADSILLEDRFSSIDVFLVQAMLYLQCNDPRIKARVLKYLRCEDLTEHDRRLLGNIVPCIYEDAPSWIIQRLGQLMWAVERAPLIVCVDQLEDVFDLEEAAVKFRRAMATLCDIVSRIPSAIVVIACLDNFYEELKKLLTRPIVDRVENDPPPVGLQSPCNRQEVERLIGQRLAFLYKSMDAVFKTDEPTYPLPELLVRTLVGMRARDVLSHVQIYRERCIEKGKMAEFPFSTGAAVPVLEENEREITLIEQAWNELRSAFSTDVTVDEAELAAILGLAIRSCSNEVESNEDFGAETNGQTIAIVHQISGRLVAQILVGVCNRRAQGGGLSRQIEEIIMNAGERTPVIVRSTDYPSNPKTAVVQQIGRLITGGGRRVVVEDADWRTMIAFVSFSEQRSADLGFTSWLKRTRPLTSLKSLRLILDLDHHNEPSPHAVKPARLDALVSIAPPLKASLSRQPTSDIVGDVVIGSTNDHRGEPVIIEPAELTQHAAFLGAPGSGKTTAALHVIEQVLLQAIPAILVDRKGDLCSYARPDMGLREGLEADSAEQAKRLRTIVEVALFTPRQPHGRPLSIAAVPAGLGALPDSEREQAARHCAAALTGMMNYSDRNRDQSCLAILSLAIDLLSRETPARQVPISKLVEFIAERDPKLVSAAGRLDPKLFDHLVQDLETLRLNQGDLLAADGEPLDIEALFGLGPHRRPGKTRLSIISTKFLGTNQDVQFWVAQFLMTLGRWISRSPASPGTLQAVVLFDEADLYLPAVRQPASKEPMEHLLRRARSAGLGLLLATQSPGDFDYRCRDNIRTWLLGQVKEANSLAKMKPMLSLCRTDVAAQLPSQEPGKFFLIRDGQATSLTTLLSSVAPRQIPEDEIVSLARRTISR